MGADAKRALDGRKGRAIGREPRQPRTRLVRSHGRRMGGEYADHEHGRSRRPRLDRHLRLSKEHRSADRRTLHAHGSRHDRAAHDAVRSEVLQSPVGVGRQEVHQSQTRGHHVFRMVRPVLGPDRRHLRADERGRHLQQAVSRSDQQGGRQEVETYPPHLPRYDSATPKPAMSLGPGARLGPYELVSAIGAGGMGEVYRARDSGLQRDVAIKVLPTTFSSDPERLARFEQEARAAAALNHPNILAVHDIGTHDGAPYIVSELLEGATLREKITGLPVRKSIDYAIQIARGLAAAHEKGVVHRDLKPENIFITADDR